MHVCSGRRRLQKSAIGRFAAYIPIMTVEFTEVFSLLLMRGRLKVSYADAATRQYPRSASTCCHGYVCKLLSTVVIVESFSSAAMMPGVAGNCLHVPDAVLKSLWRSDMAPPA